MYPSTGEKQQSMMAQIISRNDFESLLLFLQHGYEVNKMDHNGLTALHHAAGYGKFGLAII